jgi:hypothetical protein
MAELPQGQTVLPQVNKGRPQGIGGMPQGKTKVTQGKEPLSWGTVQGLRPYSDRCMPVFTKFLRPSILTPL